MLGPEASPAVMMKEWAGVTQMLQRMVLACLAVIALVCLHEFLYQLRSLLVPFVLAGFLVFAVEPTVEIIYRLLAGHAAPYRWCICCCQRRRSKAAASLAAQLEAGGGAAGSALGSDGHDPAVVGGMEAPQSTQPTSMLDSLVRVAAVLIMLCAMFLVMLAFIGLLVHGAMHLKASWAAYSMGLEKMLRWLDEATKALYSALNLQRSVDPQVKNVYNYSLTKLQDTVSLLVNEIVTRVSTGVSTFVVVSLYVLFWLLRPMSFEGCCVAAAPIFPGPPGVPNFGSRASAVIRNYIWRKTFVSLLYGTWVALLFTLQGNDLAIFFGMVSFFLNYVPEVGAIISIMVPIPVILLDGRLQSPWWTALVATLGQLLLKLLINNVLEMKLVEHDRELSVHPVWVLFNLNYFGYVWGPIGMLISVPMLAMLKSAAISVADGGDEAAARWAEALICCLEGRPPREKQSAPAHLSPEEAAEEAQPLLQDAEAEGGPSSPGT